MSLAINVSTYVSAGYTGKTIRWRLQEDVSNILNEIKEEEGPHGQTYNMSFDDNIRDIPYRLELYAVPSGSTIGNLIKSFVITPTTNTLVFDADIEMIVDGDEDYDPVSGESSVVIEALKDKDFYIVQRGIGQLLSEREPEYIWDNDTTTLSLTGGATFTSGDIYIAKIRPTVVINPPGSQISAGIYKDVVLKTDDFTLTAPDFGKMFIVDGAAAVVTVTFPPIDQIPEKIPVFIESVGQTHNNVVCEAESGEKIQTWDSDQQMILGRSERAQFVRLGDVLYGFSDSVDIKKVLQFEWGEYVGPNRLVADGTEYDVADYPRVKKQLDKLPAGQVKTYTQWAATGTVNGVTGIAINKGFFAISNDGTKFKVPDRRNKFIRAIKNIGGSDSERVENKPNGYQDSMNKAHGHRVNTTGNQSGVDPGRSLQRAATNGDGFANDDNALGVGASGHFIQDSGGVESRGENIASIPLIII